ncbi:MAG: hypothetical protein OEY99_07425 [Aigarchaeota archaeon]|nr:hypothetical protein [Aigarchaeota archaeon]MDH5704030.1 hypothetical protein [Aigarchaeota archaeon]
MTSPDRAISSILATVVVVGVAVALAIGASIWTTSTTSYFSPYESLHAYHVWSEVTPQGDYAVKARIKNNGMTELTIDNVLINSKPFPHFADGVQVTVDVGGGPVAFDPDDPSTMPTLSQQEQALLTVQIPGEAANHGQGLEGQIHTAGGKTWHFYTTLP